MKTLIFLLCGVTALAQSSMMLLLGVSGGVGACGATYAHCAALVVPSQSATFTGFPASYVGTGLTNQLATAANGGQVQNTTTQTGGGQSITVPADFTVTSDTCVTPIPFEWESYSATTGAFSLWYSATLSSSTTTTITACWGAASVTTYQGNVSGTWNANYVIVAHMADNAASTTVIDSTSHASNGVAGRNTSGTFTASGNLDGASVFNGSTDKDTFPQALSGTTYSVSAWVNPTTYGLSGIGNGIFYQGTGASNSGLSLQVYLTNNGLRWSAGSGAFVSSNSNVITLNTWQLVAYTYNAGTYTFYVNGVAQGTGTQSNGSFTDSTYAGAWYNFADTTRFFNGTIDEWRVNNTTLSAAWLAAEYLNQSSPATFYSSITVH